MAKKKAETIALTPEITIEERLTALYQLQAVATEIDRIRTLRGELPMEVRELEDELEGRLTRYQKFQSELVRIAEQAKRDQENIRNAKDAIEKFTEQLNSIRNNREYDLLSKDIEFQNLEIQGFEKSIRIGRERAEKITADMEALSIETESRKQDLKRKQEELNEIIEETKTEEEYLQAKAEALEEKIDERLLVAFGRTRKSCRNGLAVVSIDRGACMGCFNKIPPQRILDVQARKKIIVCEYCGRVLVDQELASSVTGKEETNL